MVTFHPLSRNGGRRCLLLSVTTAAALLAAATPSQAAPFVYVTDVNVGGVGAGGIAQFGAGAGGLLAPLSPPAVSTGEFPSSLVVSPDGQSLYVTNHDSNSISQYGIGAAGRLSPKSPATVSTGARYPLYLAVNPDGRSAYVSNDGNTVSQYTVGAGGRLSPKSPLTVSTFDGPLGLTVSPDGRSVYVANASFEHGGPPRVTQYDVGSGGKLSPKSPLAVAAGLSPRAVAVSPDGRSAYVVNGEYPSFSVSQFDVGAGGRLSPKSPPSVPAGTDPRQVAVSPDGKSVYVTNDDPGNDVVQYDVGAGGRLSPKSPPTVAAGFSAAGIAVSPEGRSVYVANSGDDDVSQYSVGAGGRLLPKSPATVAAGESPHAVAVTPRTPGWEGWATNRASGCRARVQVPYLDGNKQVTAYTKVDCPKPTQLTIKSRLRSDYQSADITVAQRGCTGKGSCVVDEPAGVRYFRLTCPKSSDRRNNQPYYSDIIFYPGTNSDAATKERSGDKFLSPFCAH